MTICPIAIAVGCQKCPVFKICPAKSILGDVPKALPAKPAATPNTKASRKPTAKPAKKAATKVAVGRRKTS